MLKATLQKKKLSDTRSCSTVVTISATAGEDPCVFVVRKLKDTESGDPTELVSVASPADLEIYGTEVSLETLYRVSTITLATSDAEKMTELLTELLADLQIIGEYLLDPEEAVEEIIIQATHAATGPFVFGDMGSLAE